jgi:hypothetical protein
MEDVVNMTFFHWHTGAASLLELGSYIYSKPDAITVQL